MSCLRPLERNDLLALRQWRNNRELRNETHGFRFPVNQEMEEQWYENSVLNASPGRALFAIQDTQQRFIGTAQLNQIDFIHRNASLGIYIGDENQRGKGMGKAAVTALLNYGFKDLNLHKIYLNVNASNKAAIATYEKTGFVVEGRLREHYFMDGAWQDLIFMSKFSEN